MLALLYDVHGNLPALEAVLDDARGAGADRFLLGAAYALVGDGGEVRHRRVAHDHTASAAAVRERLGEAGEEGARRIERASLGVE